MNMDTYSKRVDVSSGYDARSRVLWGKTRAGSNPAPRTKVGTLSKWLKESGLGPLGSVLHRFEPYMCHFVYQNVPSGSEPDNISSNLVRNFGLWVHLSIKVKLSDQGDKGRDWHVSSLNLCDLVSVSAPSVELFCLCNWFRQTALFYSWDRFEVVQQLISYHLVVRIPLAFCCIL